MLNHLPFSRYDVSVKTRDVVRSDYTKNYPNIYEDNVEMWRGSTTINLHKTKNFNPHKLVEYGEHPHRYIEQTSTPAFNFVNMRDTENVSKIESKVVKPSTHGVVQNEGLVFIKY